VQARSCSDEAEGGREDFLNASSLPHICLLLEALDDGEFDVLGPLSDALSEAGDPRGEALRRPEILSRVWTPLPLGIEADGTEVEIAWFFRRVEEPGKEYSWMLPVDLKPRLAGGKERGRTPREMIIYSSYSKAYLGLAQALLKEWVVQ
jgi:hypothetical protein